LILDKALEHGIFMVPRAYSFAFYRAISLLAGIGYRLSSNRQGQVPGLLICPAMVLPKQSILDIAATACLSDALQPYHRGMHDKSTYLLS
jgi:hypothetical protein